MITRSFHLLRFLQLLLSFNIVPMFLAVLTLGGLFQDHMVLQRGRPNPIWGTDTPQSAVTLTVEAAKSAPLPAPIQVTVGPDGTWRLVCPELPAGGPYRLRVKSGSEEKVLDDVLVGDVWIASGQSNMEWPLARAANAEREIATANWPGIRVAKIANTVASSPQSNVSTSWAVCTPANARNFTAVGYFFARDLHHQLGIPIGIIDSSWGGTRVEAWMSREAVRAVAPDIEAELNHVSASAAELPRIRAEYEARLAHWEKTAFPQDESNIGEPHGWARSDFEDSSWRTIVLPKTVQAEGLAANGAFWFRHSIDLPADAVGKDIVLSLGALDDFDTTYFNGERVGGIGSDTPGAYMLPRRYVVPGRLVHAGKNVIATRIFDRYGDGGFMGPTTKMFIESGGKHLALDGAWRWQIEREIPLVSSTIFASQPPIPVELQNQNSATALYNGMIAPLVGYGIRGFIWYQGEANVATFSSYRDRFTAMIRDWRTRWGEGTLPFYFVQLASFLERPEWPYLREAQTQTLVEPGTGMVVTLDVGDAHSIHPIDKQNVGHRLALIARARTYGDKNLVDSGPAFTRVEIEGSSARIFWLHGDGLHTHDGLPTVRCFELAGADGTFHPASAKIEGDTVVVTSPAVSQPVSVRYAWAEAPDVNLENAAGLPAAPFRTDTWR